MKSGVRSNASRRYSKPAAAEASSQQCSGAEVQTAAAKLPSG